MELAKNTLEKYGGDPGRIFLMGESAGGLFALYAGAAAGSEQLSKALGCRFTDMHIKGIALNSGMLYTS